MSDSQEWRAVVAALADERRLSLFARIVLGASGDAITNEADLTSREVRGARALQRAGLVTRDETGRLTHSLSRLCDLLVAENEPDRRSPSRFLVRGRLEQLPRRRADRMAVILYLVHELLPDSEQISETQFMNRLSSVALDPVGLRRELVDAGLVGRTRDGAAYWRVGLGAER